MYVAELPLDQSINIITTDWNHKKHLQNIVDHMFKAQSALYIWYERWVLQSKYNNNNIIGLIIYEVM